MKLLTELQNAFNAVGKTEEIAISKTLGNIELRVRLSSVRAYYVLEFMTPGLECTIIDSDEVDKITITPEQFTTHLNVLTTSQCHDLSELFTHMIKHLTYTNEAQRQRLAYKLEMFS